MKTFTHKYNPKTLALLTLAISCMMLIGFMPKIHAEQATFLIYSTGLNEGYTRTYATQNDQVAYCFDANLEPVVDNGTAYYPTPKEVDAEISYLMLHGYPTTTFINGVNFSRDDAQLITQIAVWIHQGFIDENGVVSDKVQGQFQLDDNRVLKLIKDHEPQVLEAANYLVNQARAEGPKSNIPAEMRSQLYTPESNDFQRMLVGPQNPWGRLTMSKSINLPSNISTTSEYDISQIEFELYKDDKPTGKAFKISNDKMDVNGYIGYDKDNPSHEYIDVSPGFYTIVEKNVPKGIEGSTENQKIYVGAYTGDSSIEHASIANKAKYIPIDILIRKVGSGNEQPQPLSGAYFEVTHTLGDTKRTWILESDRDGVVKIDKEHFVNGDDFYGESDDQTILPLGSLSIKEIKAPDGYALSDKTININLSDYIDAQKKFSPITIENKKIRSNLKFVKKDGNTGQPLAYVPFRLTSIDTDESHIIYTNAKGVFDSSSIHHSYNTNSNDTNSSDKLKTLPEDTKSIQTGLWFEGKDKEEVTDELGSLPYGTYKLEELRGETNAGYELVSMTFDVKNSGVMDLGDILNWKVGIRTNLTAEDSDNTSTILRDKISYKNLPQNKEYSIVTTFVVIDDSGEPEPLMVNGDNFTQTTTIKPESRDGETIIECSIPKKNLSGKTIVAYEEIYQGDELIASHKNPHDKDQTVMFETEKTIHKTGYSNKTKIALIAGISLACVGIYVYLKKQRNAW